MDSIDQPGRQEISIAESGAPGNEQMPIEEQFKNQLQFEQLLSELSAAFVNLPAEQVDREIEDWLRRIVELLDLDGATVLQATDDRTSSRVSHSWIELKREPTPVPITDAEIPWISERTRRGEVTVFSDLDGLPDEAEDDKAFMERAGIRSMVAIPLSVGGSIFGAITLGSVRTERSWPDQLVQRLRLIGEVFANALSRKRTEIALLESEEKFLKAFQSSPALMAISLMEDGRYIEVNERFLGSIGYQREEVIGRTARELNIFPFPELRDAMVETLRRGGPVRNFDCPINTRSGETLYGSFSAESIRLRDRECALMVMNDITERIQSEEIIRQERDRAQLYLDIAGVIIVAIDTNQRVTMINQKGAFVLGYRDDEIIGHNWFDEFVPEDARARVKATFNLLMTGDIEPVEYFENSVLTKNGEERLIAWHNALLRNEDGAIIGTLSSGEDITDHKRAERALVESQERFERVAQQSKEMVWEVNAEGLFTYVSQASEDILGYLPDEMIGKMHFYDLQFQDDHERFRLAALRQIASRESFHNQVNQARTKSGRTVWFLTSGAPAFDELGNLKGYVGADLDITERKRAEEALRESEAQLGSILRAAPIGIGMVMNRDIVHANDRLCAMTGYGLDELLGQSARLLYPTQEEFEFVGQEKYSQIAKRGSGTVETRWLRKDGAIIDILLSSTPLDIDDLHKGVTFTALDITDRKRAEEEAQKLASIVRHSRELVNLAMLDGRMIFLNEAGCEILGLDPEEIHGKSILDVISGHLQEKVRGDLLPKLHEGGSWEGELEYVNQKTGGLVVVHAMTFAIKDSLTGQPLYLANVSLDVTERKRAEEALKRMAVEWRTTFDAISEGVMMLDTEFHVLRCNRAMNGIVNRETTGVLESCCYLVVHGTSAPIPECPARQALATKVRATAELELGGSWYQVVADPIVDEGGRVTAIAHVMIDITERKRAEEALLRKNDYLTALYGTTLDLVSELDLDSLLEHIVRRAGLLMGTPAGYLDLLEPGAVHLTPKVGFGVLTESLKFSVQLGEGLTGKVWETGQPMVLDDYDVWPERLPDHAYGLLRAIIAVPLLSRSGVLGVLGLASGRETEQTFGQEAIDLLGQFARYAAIAIENARLYSTARQELVERKQAEEALRQSEEKFSKIFESSPNMVVICTIEEGRVLEINDKGADALGFTREEMIGKTPDQLGIITPGSQQDLVRDLGERGSFNNLEKQIRTKAGKEIVGLFSGQVIHIGGKPYLLLTIVDISERKRFGALLKYAVEGTSSAVGRNFFRPLVKYLATALEMRYAYIGELTGSQKNEIGTLAVWSGGKAGKNLKYNLAGTPCDNVVGRSLRTYPSSVQSLFPRDPLLIELNVESYLGAPLSSSSGEPLGVLVVMDDKPFPEAIVAHARALVSIFAARAAAELERLKVEEELQEASERLESERGELAEKNIALKQVLDHLERGKEDFKHQISASTESLLRPFVDKLRKNEGQLKSRDIELFENALNSIVGSGLDEFASSYSKLTPREVDICEGIKSGLSSKQIADELSIDILTVHKHRDSIRCKLQLKHKDLNLAAYLRSK
jgi:PAS domain S-box-containing protein